MGSRRSEERKRKKKVRMELVFWRVSLLDPPRP